jgi:Inner membrane component of T3SS, cytoplasmic domain
VNHRFCLEKKVQVRNKNPFACYRVCIYSCWKVSRGEGLAHVNTMAMARFATACGAFAPLELAIEYEDGTVATHGSLAQPFALIGSDSSCDIALNSPDIDPQHAVIQVLGGHVFVSDLGSASGLRWGAKRHPYGWLNVNDTVKVGPFVLRLTAPVSPHPASFGPNFHPLAPGPDVPIGLPPTALEFRTGLADRPRWTVNRVITLIGTAPECKINLSGEGIKPRHCYLLHTHDGLWIVDLTGQRLPAVNGDRVRFARLAEGDDLIIGPFVFRCLYPGSVADQNFDEGLVSFDDVPRPPKSEGVRQQATHASPSPKPKSPAFTPTPPGLRSSIATTPPPRNIKTKTDHDADIPPPKANEPQPADWTTEEATDLVRRPNGLSGPMTRPRDVIPLSDSEILQLVNATSEGGPIDSGELINTPSNGLGPVTPSPIDFDLPNVLSESNPPVNPPAIPTTAPSAEFFANAITPPPMLATALQPVIIPNPGPSQNQGLESITPVLRQLADMQSQMFSQFQQSLMMMMQMFGQMQREQTGVIQQELGRLSELNAELVKLQTEMLKSKEQPPEPTAPTYENPLPNPDDVPGTTEQTAEQHNWVWERMNKLNEERQSIWQRLYGMLGTKGNGGTA